LLDFYLIHGERRWRASQFAGLKEIPAIIKDISDGQLMLESLIENVHRKDLNPIEKARGLAEVYRLARIKPASALNGLMGIHLALSTSRKLKPFEMKVKEVADLIGLSYDYQYKLLTQLKLTPEEQKRVTELELGYEKISTIATVEKPEVRKKFIEIAPD